MKNKIAVLAGVIVVSFAAHTGFAGEVSKENTSKMSKSEVFKSDTSIPLFVSDIGILTDKEMAAVKKNLFIEILKADIDKNQKSKS